MKQFGEKIEGVVYIDRPGAYAILVNSEDKLAVIRTPTGFFLPGGGVEDREDLTEALHRELIEETGLTVTILRQIGVASQFIYSAEEKKGFNKIGTFFLAKIIGEKSTAIEADHELLWLSKYEASEKLKHEYQRWAVQETCRHTICNDI